MSDAANPSIVALTDLDSFSKEFIIARPFRFQLEGEPDKTFEVKIRPLTEAQLATARAFTQLAPPKVKRKVEGSEQEVEEDDWADPDFQKQVMEKSAQRLAYIFDIGLPDLNLGGDNLEAKSKLIQEKFPPGYATSIEREILRRSTNDLAIINLANFSASASSAQS
jgi:hypothetical protein